MNLLTGSWDETHEAPWQQCSWNDHFFIKAGLAGRSLWQVFPQPSSNCSTAKIFMSLQISTPVVSDFTLLMAHFMPSRRKGRRAAFPGWTWTHLFASCELAPLSPDGQSGAENTAGSTAWAFSLGCVVQRWDLTRVKLVERKEWNTREVMYLGLLCELGGPIPMRFLLSGRKEPIRLFDKIWLSHMLLCFTS